MLQISRIMDLPIKQKELLSMSYSTLEVDVYRLAHRVVQRKGKDLPETIKKNIVIFMSK